MSDRGKELILNHLKTEGKTKRGKGNHREKGRYAHNYTKIGKLIEKEVLGVISNIKEKGTSDTRINESWWTKGKRKLLKQFWKRTGFFSQYV